MKKPYEVGFDIRTQVPDYDSGNGGDDADPKVQRLYDQINVMCYLLHDITYDDLNHMIGKNIQTWETRFAYIKDHPAEVAPPDTNVPYSTQELVNMATAGARLMHEIIIYVGDYDKVSLHQLYTDKFTNLSKAARQVCHKFNELYAADTAGFLCLPFVEARLEGELIKEEDMHEHRSAPIRQYSLYQLFMRHEPDVAKRKELNKAVNKGRDTRILKSNKLDILFPAIGGGGNNRVCKSSGHGCETKTGSWCSLDENGDCSPMGG